MTLNNAFEHLSPFSSVSIIEFEQVSVCLLSFFEKLQSSGFLKIYSASGVWKSKLLKNTLLLRGFSDFQVNMWLNENNRLTVTWQQRLSGSYD